MKTCTKCKVLKAFDEFHRVSNSTKLRSSCKVCNNADNARYYKNNRKLIRAKYKRYYEAHKDVILEKQVEYAGKNAEKLRQKSKNHYKANKSKYLHKYKLRQCRKIKATPKWLSEDQLEELELFYKNRPEGYHVDHIVPLKGKNISGLHVPWNLQYLPAKDNLKKSNKY